MPSRVIHDLLRHILETSEVHFEEEPLHDYTISGFQRVYMGHFPPQIILRRVLRHREIEDLPVNRVQELLEYLNDWIRNGIPINVGRRFRNVRLARVERVPCMSTFEYDFRLEFIVDSIDMEDMISNTVRRSAMLPPDYMEVNKCKIKMPPKKHFEDDLFKV